MQTGLWYRPSKATAKAADYWIPAFAGMTLTPIKAPTRRLQPTATARPDGSSSLRPPGRAPRRDRNAWQAIWPVYPATLRRAFEQFPELGRETSRSAQRPARG